MNAPSERSYWLASVVVLVVMVTGSYGISVSDAVGGRKVHASVFLAAAAAIAWTMWARWSVRSCVIAWLLVGAATLMRTVNIATLSTANAGQRSYAISASVAIWTVSGMIFWSAARHRALVLAREAQGAATA